MTKTYLYDGGELRSIGLGDGLTREEAEAVASMRFENLRTNRYCSIVIPKLDGKTIGRETLDWVSSVGGMVRSRPDQSHVEALLPDVETVREYLNRIDRRTDNTVFFQDTTPADPIPGDTWFTVTGKRFRRWSGSAWVQLLGDPVEAKASGDVDEIYKKLEEATDGEFPAHELRAYGMAKAARDEQAWKAIEQNWKLRAKAEQPLKVGDKVCTTVDKGVCLAGIVGEIIRIKGGEYLVRFDHERGYRAEYYSRDEIELIEGSEVRPLKVGDKVRLTVSQGMHPSNGWAPIIGAEGEIILINDRQYEVKFCFDYDHWSDSWARTRDQIELVEGSEVSK